MNEREQEAAAASEEEEVKKICSFQHYTYRLDFAIYIRIDIMLSLFGTREKKNNTNKYIAGDWNRIRGLVTGVNINGNGIKVNYTIIYVSNAYSCLIREVLHIIDTNIYELYV